MDKLAKRKLIDSIYLSKYILIYTSDIVIYTFFYKFVLYIILNEVSCFETYILIKLLTWFSELNCKGTPPSFSVIHVYSKGDNFHAFLFAYLEDEVFPTGVISGRKEFAPIGPNSFLFEMSPDEMRNKHENKTEAFPESVPIHLKRRYWLQTHFYGTKIDKNLDT